MLITIFTIAARLYPQQVIFIRHAEKDGDLVHLSDIGRQRAKDLPIYFDKMKIYPSVFIAMKQKSFTSSNRPFETLLPLANYHKQQIINDYKSEEYKKVYILVNHPKYTDKTVVVCWAHDNLVKLAKLFGVAIRKWDKNDYTSLWRLENTFDNFKCKLRIRQYKMFTIDNHKINYSHIHVPIKDEWILA